MNWDYGNKDGNTNENTSDIAWQCSNLNLKISPDTLSKFQKQEFNFYNFFQTTSIKNLKFLKITLLIRFSSGVWKESVKAQALYWHWTMVTGQTGKVNIHHVPDPVVEEFSSYPGIAPIPSEFITLSSE